MELSGDFLECYFVEIEVSFSDQRMLAHLCNGGDTKLVSFYYQTKNQWCE